MPVASRAIERPRLGLHLPRAQVRRVPVIARTTIQLVFATAAIAVLGGACLGFIVGYAVAQATGMMP